MASHVNYCKASSIICEMINCLDPIIQYLDDAIMQKGFLQNNFHVEKKKKRFLNIVKIKITKRF